MDVRKLKDLSKAQGLPLEQAEGGAAIAVRLTKMGDEDTIVAVQDDVIEINLTIPHAGETANKRLITFLAKQLNVKASQIEVIAGHSGSEKLVSIIGMAPDEVVDRLSL